MSKTQYVHSSIQRIQNNTVNGVCIKISDIFNNKRYSGNADFFAQNGVFVAFLYRSRIISFFAISNAFWRKKNAFKRRFPFSQSHGIDKNAVYRFKLSSLSFILLTNKQPFQAKRF